MPCTNWKPAWDAVLTVGGSELKCTSCSVQVQFETFDTTNTTSDGAREFGIGVKSVSLQFEMPVDDDTPAVPDEGTCVAASYADGEATYSGNFVITSITKRGGGRGGYSVSGSAESTGTVTKS
jgi:hypothetical protein